MGKWIFALIAGVAVFAALTGCASNGEKMNGAMRVLDGRSFAGTLSVQGSDPQQEMRDTVIFENGMFRSTACDQYGFESAPYTAQPAGMNAAFHATTVNEKGDRMAWSGLITGMRADATATLDPAKGEQVKYVFSGMETR